MQQQYPATQQVSFTSPTKKKVCSYRYATDKSMFSQFQYKEAQIAKKSFSKVKEANTNNPMVQEVLKQLLKQKSNEDSNTLLLPQSSTEKSTSNTKQYIYCAPNTVSIPTEYSTNLSITNRSSSTSQLFKMNIQYILN